MAKKRTPESYVMDVVEDYLGVQGIDFIRCNSGNIFGSKNGSRWRIKLNEVGTADFLALPPAGSEAADFWDAALVRPTWIECKAPNGKQSEPQKEFQRKKEAIGHRYILCFGLDDLVDAGL